MLKVDNNLSFLILNVDNRNEDLSFGEFIIVYSCC